MPRVPGDVFASQLATDIDVVQFQEPGVCQIVTAQSASPTGMFVWTTAIGSIDELMSYAVVLDFLSSDSGAVLEVAADGLRLSSAALGDGLKGGSAEVVTIDVDGLSEEATPADTDVIQIETAAGLRKVRYSTLTSGAVGNTDLGNTPFESLVTVTSSTGAPTDILDANIARAGVMTKAQATKLNGIQDGSTLSNLNADPSPTAVNIENTGGTDALIAAANDTDAGVMRSLDKQKLDAISDGATVSNLGEDQQAAFVTITNTGGDGVNLSPSTDAVCGVMTPTQFTALAGLSEAGSYTFKGNATGIPGVAQDIFYTDIAVNTPVPGSTVMGWNAIGIMSRFDIDSLTSTSAAVQREATWTAHGLVANDLPQAIRWSNSGAVVKADSTIPDATHTDFVVAIIDPDTVQIQVSGYYAETGHGLEVNSFYGLLADGSWSNELDDLNLTYRDMVAYIPDADNILLLGPDYRDNVASGGGTGDGDMTKAVYDQTDNSIVDKSESLVIEVEAGETIAALKLVSLTGFASPNPVATLADQGTGKLANAISLGSATIGVALDSLVAGVASGIDTTGMAVGDYIYLGSGGDIAKVAPTSGVVQSVGFVLEVGASGTVVFRIAIDVDNVTQMIDAAIAPLQWERTRISNGDAGSTFTADFTTGGTQAFTLVTACALTLQQPPTTGMVILEVKQDGTGGWPIDWSNVMLKGTAPTINLAAGEITVVPLYFDGNNYHVQN